MKIIHCADLHLGSSLESMPTNNSNERRKEINEAFIKLLEYANKNDIHNIILSGDVFDSNQPISTDKEFFYSLVKQYSDITFYYLKGNHDNKTSIIEEYDNLKTFNDNQWTYYKLGNITICGLEITKNNQRVLYEDLFLDKDDINIVILHGDFKKEINLTQLANKNISYLALGHIHSYQEISLDDKGKAFYSGCLEGRGFDETGSKGFIVLDINDKQIQTKFIKNSIREIYLKTINLNNLNSLDEAIKVIKEQLVDIANSSIIRLILKGKVNFNPAELDNIHIMLHYYYLEIVNEVTKAIDFNSYQDDLSLRGEFIRIVLNDKELDEKTKEEILNYGLMFLDNEREIDI